MALMEELTAAFPSINGEGSPTVQPPSESAPVMSDGELIQMLDAYWKEADESQKSRQHADDRLWNLYWDKQDFSDKLPWQTKIVLPRTFMSVEQAGQLVKRSLIQAGSWWSVETASDRLKPYEEAVRLLLRAHLKVTQAESLIAQAVKVMLLSRVAEVEVGFDRSPLWRAALTPPTPLTMFQGFLAKAGVIAPPQEQIAHVPTPQAKLSLILKDPKLIRRDPSGRGLYVIARDQVDWATLLQMKEAWRAESLSEITADFVRADEEWAKARQKDETVPQPAFRKRVSLDRVWGTFLDREGNLKLANGCATVANERHVLASPTPNPFFHGHSPYVQGALVRVPFSTSHRSLFEGAAALHEEFNRMVCWTLDAIKYELVQVTEIDPDKLDEESVERLKEGIKFGLSLVRRANAPAGAAITPVTLGSMPAEIGAVLQLLDRELQAGTAVSEMKLGVGPTKGQPTLGELQLREGASGSLFDGLARDLEDTFLEVLLERSWQTILQYQQPSDPLVQSLDPRIGQLLGSLSLGQRLHLIQDGFAFRVHGLSAMLARNLDRQNLIGMLQVIAQSDALMQAFFQQFDPNKLIQILFTLFGQDPKAIEREPGSVEAPPQAMGGM